MICKIQIKLLNISNNSYTGINHNPHLEQRWNKQSERFEAHVVNLKHSQIVITKEKCVLS